MKVIFKLKNKAQSVNSGYYKNRTRTQSTRKWSLDIHDQLSDPLLKQNIERLREGFNPLSHSLSVTICYYIPHDKFYTKKGNISRKSGDLDNCIKLLLDTVFDPRFFKRDLFNFNIDDQFITDLPTKKRPADKYSISLEVEILCNKTFMPI